MARQYCRDCNGYLKGNTICPYCYGDNRTYYDDDPFEDLFEVGMGALALGGLDFGGGADFDGGGGDFGGGGASSDW